MKEKTLVVMAAGMGSRFGGLKQIEPVGPNNEFIIDYSVYDAIKSGFTKVVFVIKHELEEAFKETIGKRLEGKIEIAYAYQEIEDIPSKKYLAPKRTKPWGTVQAILCAKNQVNGSFVVINADDFYGRDSFLVASKFLDEVNDKLTYACITYPFLVTSSNYGSVKRGVCTIKEDNIENMVECKITKEENYGYAQPLNGGEAFKIDLNHPVSMNMFAFQNNFFDFLEEYFNNFFKASDEEILNSEALLPEVIKEKLESNTITLKNIVSNGLWMGMTYKEELDLVKNQLKELIKKGEYKESLWS